MLKEDKSMTTRIELLDAFEAKLDGFLLPATIGQQMPDKKSGIKEAVVSLDRKHEVEWHFTNYWDNETGNVHNCSFYVRDRGKAGEVAVWFKGNDPKPPIPDATFQQQLTAWLQGKVSDGTILHFSNVAANNDTERATCTVVIDEAGILVEKRVALWKDAEGRPRYQVITTA